MDPISGTSEVVQYTITFVPKILARNVAIGLAVAAVAGLVLKRKAIAAYFSKAPVPAGTVTDPMQPTAAV